MRHTMSRLPRIKFIVVAGLALALVAYVVSYLSRSAQGRYEPAAIGLNGVKWYNWAPKGFVTDFKWDNSLLRVYSPLHALDTLFWHKANDAFSGKYPVDAVAPKDIGKVYQAWK